MIEFTELKLLSLLQLSLEKFCGLTPNPLLVL